VPGGITGPPCSWRIKIRGHGLQVGGVSNLTQPNMVMSPTGLRPENDCAGPEAVVTDRPTLSSERLLHKDYNRRGSVDKKSLVVSLKEFFAKTN
jgi:hypothetical protein